MVVRTKENVADQVKYPEWENKCYWHVSEVGQYLKGKSKEALEKGKKE